MYDHRVKLMYNPNKTYCTERRYMLTYNVF